MSGNPFEIDVTGISKPRLLMELYNGAKKPLSIPHEIMSYDQAEAIINKHGLAFQYLNGRAMKIDLTDHTINFELYYRDNGIWSNPQHFIKEIRDEMEGARKPDAFAPDAVPEDITAAFKRAKAYFVEKLKTGDALRVITDLQGNMHFFNLLNPKTPRDFLAAGLSKAMSVEVPLPWKPEHSVLTNVLEQHNYPRVNGLHAQLIKELVDEGHIMVTYTDSTGAPIKNTSPHRPYETDANVRGMVLTRT